MADFTGANEGLRELALFAGAGGGILGGHLLGWQTVCAVEWEPYAASVLAARQNDGLLAPFPIWDDVQTFDGRPWRGCVDVVSGGFPCQDISVAGKGAGIDGARSGMWGHMARIVGEVRPRYVFVENSPALLTRGLGRVLGDLAALGYDCRWTVLGAADVGAPHQRDRFWLVAHTEGSRMEKHRTRNADLFVGSGATISSEESEKSGGDVANAHDAKQCADSWTGCRSDSWQARDDVSGLGVNVAHADRIDDALQGHAEDHAEEVAGRRVVAGGGLSDCGAGCQEGAGEGAGDVAHTQSQRERSGTQSRWDDGRGKQLEGAGPWGDAYDCGFEVADAKRAGLERQPGKLDVGGEEPGRIGQGSHRPTAAQGVCGRWVAARWWQSEP